MDKYADALPVNARITVDYTKPNNPVTFEYPLEDRNIKKWVLSFIFPAVLIVWVLITGFSVIGYTILTNPNIIFNTETPETTFVLSEFLIELLQLAPMLFIAFVPPLLISYYIGHNYDKFKYWFPKFQAFVARLSSSKHFHTFIVDELKEPVFEIPLFQNILLSYEASGDFFKYLQRVEIREHDFCYQGEKTQWL